MPCMVCGHPPKVDAHHVSTNRSAHARGDTKDNLTPLCRMHHVMIHTMGKKTFFEKHPVMIEWAKENKRYDLLD